MILSASRRTDIPAYFMPWFMKRLTERLVYVPHPFRSNHYRKINLNPDVIDCIVFWTKNPIPLISYLDDLKNTGYPYYLQCTITGYSNAIEPSLPDLDARIHAFQAISKSIGRNRIVWRYDPILLTDSQDIAYHIHNFTDLCRMLAPFTDTCIISFLDWYPSISASLSSFTRQITKQEIYQLARDISNIAHHYRIKLATCAEAMDLSEFGIAHASCIDQTRIEQILEVPISAKKDRNQRTECGCIESIDIGIYQTCLHGCKYCYATSSFQQALRNTKQHNSHAPVLIGSLPEHAVIHEVPMKSSKIAQQSLF